MRFNAQQLFEPNSKQIKQAINKLPPMYLQQNIRILLALRGMSQSQLSRMTGVNMVTLNRLILGYHNPNQKTLQRIATGLEVEVVDLFRTDLIHTDVK